MTKPIEELLAIVVLLAVLGLAAVAFLSFLTFKSDVVDDGTSQEVSAPPSP